MRTYIPSRRSGKSEAIRQAARVADELGCNFVLMTLDGIQTAEHRANQKAIDVEFREVPEVKELTNGRILDEDLP